MAQEKKLFTLEDMIPGGVTHHKFIPENLSALKWWGDKVAYYDIEQEKLILIPARKPHAKEELELEKINQALEKAQLKKLHTLQRVTFPDKDHMLITAPDYYALYNKGSITWKMNLETIPAHPDFCYPNRTLAYTIDNNLWIANEENTHQITHEPEGVVCGQSVHRNEFGIYKGTFWSPGGKYLAFYRMDERMVTDYPLVDISTRIASLNPIKYPMAGMTSHVVTIGIYNTETRETTYLKTQDPVDRYFTNISWSPDEKDIYVIELNRDQNHAQLIKYDAQTGDKKEIVLEETHPKYVEPQHPVLFVKGTANQFIYQSQKDGFNHLYLYDTGGKLIKQLTQGNWLVQQVLGFDENGKNLFYLSTEESPLESRLYKVNLATGKRTLLTTAPGIHQVQLSSCGNYVIDNYSAADIPRIIEIVDVNKQKRVERLLEAANPYADYKMPEIEVGTLKAADGVTDLYYRLLKPIDFDATRKYPVIIYVYGGPHNQMIRNGFNWITRGWDIYMAQQGYMMLTVDNRGSMNRGLEFENVTFRHLGVEEGKDQMQGVEFLKSLPYVDENRIGVHGWSFGGHMSTALLLRYPGVFKAGVAGGPVIDWAYYEIMYGERYMDKPQDNPEGYEECNLNNLAGNLQDKLLLIHDDSDDTCVLQHTLSFMKACVDAFTFPDLFIYPGHKHNVVGHDRVHLYEKVSRYFFDNL